MSNYYIRQFSTLSISDINIVGGKNASLGEMITNLKDSNVYIPEGFAITTNAYKDFIYTNKLQKKIEEELKNCNEASIDQLQTATNNITKAISSGKFSHELQEMIANEFIKLNCDSVAVRSSATMEDLDEASFAGQQDTILNVADVAGLMVAIKQVYCSLYSTRAISYRLDHGFDENDISISVGVQRMVRSDLACSGVAFSLDTESGFNKVIFITATYGLGELLVNGTIIPDEYYVSKHALQNYKKCIISKQLGDKKEKLVYSKSTTPPYVIKKEVKASDKNKFCLTDKEITQLAKLCMEIESHYKKPMDIEWAKDGTTNKLYIVQARPETTHQQTRISHENYLLLETSSILITGKSVGKKIGNGRVQVITDVSDINSFTPGDILVTSMTDPDWEPIMKKSAAIITDRGGRTCHAAIIARELGIPAIVGCKTATNDLKTGQLVTASCASGEDGFVYDGILEYQCSNRDVNLQKLPVKLMLNIADPKQAFHAQRLPVDGIGLARLEFIINNSIGIHPSACLDVNSLPTYLRQKIYNKSQGYETPVDFYVSKIIEGVSTLATSFWPRNIIVRMSDFKSNEYANLIGGHIYEPKEENPMLGFRGANRYLSEQFKSSFALECQAIKIVREQYGLTNTQIMIPFVRSVAEASKVIDLLQENGLEKNNEFKVIMMCEIPVNILLADEFLDYFDGFSIGSNDLTQLTLGVDRDSELVANLFDEESPAIKSLISEVIDKCRKRKKYIGICGQAPSDIPGFAEWLMRQGIDSMSLTPDSVIATWENLLK